MLNETAIQRNTLKSGLEGKGLEGKGPETQHPEL